MIRFDDVSFHYGGKNGTEDGVDHIDLTIADGAFTVLIGESECGKTRLKRAMKHRSTSTASSAPRTAGRTINST